MKKYCEICLEEFRTTTNHLYSRCKKCRTKFCKHCNSEHKKRGITCSKECELKIREKRSIERHGVKHPRKLKEIDEKIKKTCLEKYGSENPFGSKIIKEKIENTCLEKYGVTNPMKSKEIKEKTEKTCIERYGAKSPFHSAECREKSKINNLKKYGIKYAFLSLEAIEKRKKTNLERYGTEYQVSSESTKAKSIKTLIENYGVDNPMKSELIKEKIQISLQEKYGSNIVNPSQISSVQEKIKETSISKYGVQHFTQNYEIQEKTKKTMIEKYGVENALMLEKTKIASHSKEATEKRMKTLKESNHNFQSSKIEDKLYEILTSVFKNVERHAIINGWDIDFYIKDINTFVNMNGIYWHGRELSEKDLIESSTKQLKTILSTKSRDLKRENWFKDNNKVLKIIWEDEIDIAIKILLGTNLSTDK